jgi:hypothetical protein
MTEFPSITGKKLISLLDKFGFVAACVFRRNPATIPRPNRPLFRRESGHRSEGNSAGVPSRFRPLFLGGSELIRTVPD